MRSRLSPMSAGLLLLAVVLACSNPLSRFTKQYKCQLAGQPEPGNALEYAQRGDLHANAGELDCALGACSEAIRLDSKNAAGYACRGHVLGQQEKFAPALKDLNEALRLEPQNGEFYFRRSHVYHRQGDTDLALGDIAKAIELMSDEFGRSVAYARRAEIYQKQGKHKEAIENYDKAIGLDPDFAWHHMHRGDVYFAQEQYEQAIANYSEAIRLKPKNEYFYKPRAEAYRKLGREELALQDDANAKLVAAGEEPTDVPAKVASASPSTKTVSGGVLNGKAVSLPKPDYPPIARGARASGTVVVQVTVDESGSVISAHPVSGHPLLRAASVSAARQAKFSPTKVSGQPVKVTGVLQYNFQPPP